MHFQPIRKLPSDSSPFEVSGDEMTRLREQGARFCEIAKVGGVSYVTVRP